MRARSGFYRLNKYDNFALLLFVEQFILRLFGLASVSLFNVIQNQQKKNTQTDWLDTFCFALRALILDI